MADVIQINGRTNDSPRNPQSRAKDYVTVEKVQGAVNILLKNDKALSENQDRLRAEVEPMTAELAQLRADASAAVQRLDEIGREIEAIHAGEALRLSARIAEFWRSLTRRAV